MWDEGGINEIFILIKLMKNVNFNKFEFVDGIKDNEILIELYLIICDEIL